MLIKTMIAAGLVLAADPAADVADAGLDEPDEARQLKVVLLPEGTVTPVEGCWMDTPDCITLAQRKMMLEAELDIRRAQSHTPPWLVVVGVGILCLAAGFGLSYVVRPPQGAQ